MSIALMSTVFLNSRTHGSARLVLIALADSAADDGECWPSIATIAKKANLSPKVTKEYLAAFGAIGLLTKEPRHAPNGRQTSNIYRVVRSMIGKDDLTPETLNQVRAKSRQKGGGGNPAHPLEGGGNPANRGEGVTPRTPSFLNGQKERKKDKGEDASLGEVVEEIIEKWNELPKPISKIVHMGDGRKRHLSSRLKDAWWRKSWREALSKVPESDFLTGRAQTDRAKPFVISIDFFLQPDTVPKILEGKYENRNGQSSLPSTGEPKKTYSAIDHMRAMGIEE